MLLQLVGASASASALTPQQLSVVRTVLSSLYYAFETGTDGEGGADAAELGTALSILAPGRKSDKLTAAWAAFDADGDGWLSLRDLARFLRAFLLGILVIKHSRTTAAATPSSADRAFTSESALAHDVATRLANAIAASVGGGPNGGPATHVRLASVGTFYNAPASASASAATSGAAHPGDSRGEQFMPWLELLDNTKWGLLINARTSPAQQHAARGQEPLPNGTAAVVAAATDKEQADAEEASPTHNAASVTSIGGSPVVFTLTLDVPWADGAPAPGAHGVANGADAHAVAPAIYLTEADCAHVLAVAHRSGLAKLNARTVAAAVMSHAKPSSSRTDLPSGLFVVDDIGFRETLRSLIPSVSQASPEMRFVTDALGHLYYSLALASNYTRRPNDALNPDLPTEVALGQVRWC
jgi:hypothetical protein